MEHPPSTAAIPADYLPQDNHFAVYGLAEGVVPYGAYAGTPAAILKLQGCPVGCSWCDEPHGIPEPSLIATANQASEEDLEQPGYHGWRWLSSTRLLALIGAMPFRHVLITGGEPAAYDLCWFTESLQEQGQTVQVETSGVLPIAVARDVWVTISPKHDVHPDLVVQSMVYKRADEVIQPITCPADEKWLDRTLKARHPGTPVYLQPLHGRPDLQALCWRLARDHQVRLCCAPPPIPGPGELAA